MAPRKTKPAPAARKAAPATVAARRAPQATPPAPSTNGSSNRLLREAAWSRMFGRVESKNPFSR